ncbi:DUF3130 family protein [Listeria aquatica]|uniref:DUF3130 family protein n=1 Tax=Listeria aquatica TaxID=1494960 RepID=UPI003F6EDC53
MAEIRIKESTFIEHAADLLEAGKGSTYAPLSAGNMSYSRANSINDLRTAIMESIEAMNQVSQLAEKDAARLKKMGHAFAEQDRAAGQKIHELEVR